MEALRPIGFGYWLLGHDAHLCGTKLQFEPGVSRMPRSILIGNGFSRSVSDRFAYRHLRDVVRDRLSGTANQFFDRFSTVNFEDVLRKIDDARVIVNEIFGPRDVDFNQLAVEVQTSLLDGVHLIHPEGPIENALDCDAVNEVLLNYDNVFTTNYDLLLYWCTRNSERGFNVDDYFRLGRFDRIDAGARERAFPTSILYLHGALFLYSTDGETRKLHRGEENALVNVIRTHVASGVYPLCISEGSAEQKLKAVRQNDYLSFAYDSLRNIEGQLEVFGQALDPAIDHHIANAILEANVDVVFLDHGLADKNQLQVDDLRASLAQRLVQHRDRLQLADTLEHPLSAVLARQDDDP